MALQIQVHRIVKERKGTGEYIPFHSHPFFHCVYVLGGRGLVQIGSETVSAKKGWFLRIAPHVEHAIFGEEDMESFDIKFSAQGDFVEFLSRLPLSMPLDEYQQNLVISIFRLAVKGEAYAREIINVRMTELFLLLLRRNNRGNADTALFPGEGSPAFLPALSYVDQHPDESPSISFLANLCGYNPSYFSTAFKAAFGCTPARYLAGKKIRLAQEQLLSFNCTVSQVAQSLGMEPAAFSRKFKKSTGMSPSQYLHRANSDLGINIEPDSPYLPAGPFEIPKQTLDET